MAEQHPKLLVRTVGRAFYDDDVVMVLDALTRDPYLIDFEKAGRSPLEEKFGLQSKQVRRSLMVLYEDCLIEKYVRKWRAPDAPKGTRRRNHIFYYINYSHFVKLVRLRLHFMRKLIDQKEGEQTTSRAMYVCPRCKIEYDLLTAVACQDEETGMFFCQRCKDDLDEHVLLEEIGSSSSSSSSSSSASLSALNPPSIKSEPGSGKANGGGGGQPSKAKSLREKRDEQMKEEPGLRLGIEDILVRIDNFPVPPPHNHPSDHLDNAEDAYREKVEEEKYGPGAGGRGASRQGLSFNEAGQAVRVQIISYPDADDLTDGQPSDAVDVVEEEVSGGQLPAWMQTDVSGNVSSNAIQDAKERQQKRGRLGGASVGGVGNGLGGAAALLERQEGNRSSSLDLEPFPKLRRTESEQHLDSVREQTLQETRVTVRGVSKPLSEITEQDENKMTKSEYADYLDKWEKVARWDGTRRPSDITDEDEASDEAIAMDFF